MNDKMNKLSQLSGYLRGLVLLATAVVIGYLGYQLGFNGELRLGSSALSEALWQDDRASHSVLLMMVLPQFVTMLLGVYWLQKLLAYYQQGLFFATEPMRCYLWLIWLKVADFFLDIGRNIAVGNYHSQFFETTEIELPIDFGNITTLLLMLVIVYLLKAAKEIEAENKEFI
ncbi:DUF2975 domain-containing protein [Shewanella sp. Scap07]|uniref:DUF2975 domain-containing protein n=1 Tax=Shewanella sp. Scap07 TaxID=2589987 RepID=UPI0015C08FD0|nr:DUF2975 domain-containing protein [Shewanella sp. Scap07]QLE87130.1 DUF2975 domain-containing protein [Shewanella sp. Scap07]